MCSIDYNQAETVEASHDILNISGMVRHRVAAEEARRWGNHMGQHYYHAHQLHYGEQEPVQVETSQI